jgi:hypothetical protein
MARPRPKINSIEEAEALLRKGYFTDDESFRISKVINSEFDHGYVELMTKKIEINNEPILKKKWWQFWK